jgi:sugar lactone lactonase YvrE
VKRAVLALALVVSACGSGGDRYLPKFAQPTTVTTTNGPVTFAVSPGGRVYYAELRTNEVFAAPSHRLVATLPHRPDSLAVDSHNRVYAATRTQSHRVRVFRGDELLWEGPTSRFPVHIALYGATVVIGVGDELLQLEPRRVISRGWTDPVPTRGRGGRVWVADNGLPGSKERVARGREQSVAKRNRFASVLPAYTNPSGMALVDDELLLCSKTHKRVYRLHIGLDEVARRRGWLSGLVCDRDIAVDARGRLYTATNGVIYRYVRQ